MHKKLAAVILIVCVLSIFAILFYQIKNEQKGFDAILGTNEADITKVLMRDCQSGIFVETMDQAKIKDFIKLFKNRDYEKSPNQEDTVGYRYYCDLFTGDKRIMRIMGEGNTVKIKDIYYDVSKSISPDSLTNWYNSVPVKESSSLAFFGESKNWTAEFKLDNIVTSTDKNGQDVYNADKSLVVTYKNDLADLAKVKKWEISCEYLFGSSTQSETRTDQDPPINNKTFVMNCGGSPDSYYIEKKDDIIKVSVTIDGKVEKFELKCKQ